MHGTINIKYVFRFVGAWGGLVSILWAQYRLSFAAAHLIQNLVLQIHRIRGGKFHIDLYT